MAGLVVTKSNLIFFVGGCLVGGICTWFAAKGHFKKKSDEAIDKFIADFYKEEGSGVLGDSSDAALSSDILSEEEFDQKLLREADERRRENEAAKKKYEEQVARYVSSKFEALKEDVNGVGGVDPAEMEHPEEEIDSDILADYEEEYRESLDLSNKEELEFAKEQELIRKGYLVTEENENDAAGEAMDHVINDPGKKIYLITESDFYDTFGHYDKVQLEYYTMDDALIDLSNEMEIDDEYRTIGYSLDETGFRKDDSLCTLFVRNDSTGTDYEINKMFTSYYAGQM